MKHSHILTGQYNETLFKGFDYILDLGRRYNVKLILAATNNWQINDGPASVCM